MKKTGLAVFDDAGRYSFLRSAVTLTNTVIFFVILVVLTLLPTLVGWLSGRQVGGFWFPMGLLVALVPGYLVLNRAVLQRKARTFIWAVVYVGSAMGIWLQAVAWTTMPALPALTAVVLVGLGTAMVFNDSQVHYDEGGLQLLQVVPALVFDLALLILDIAGHKGLLTMLRDEPEAGITWLVLQGLGILTALGILTVVGKLSRERDARLIEVTRAQSDLEVLKAEQAVVQRTCDLMLGGLQAGRFSHDVAGPLSVMGITLRELERSCPPEARPKLGPVIVDLRMATERLREMTTFMSQGLKGEHPATSREVHELIEESKQHLRHLLKGHGRDVPEMWVDLEPADVLVEPLHATAIANILANGALQGGDSPLVVLGNLDEDLSYRLVLRDHGVPPAHREAALERVQRATSLSFRPTEDSRDESYEGQGLGLFLARIVLSRQGGGIEVQEPEEGAGLELVLTLRTSQGSSMATADLDPA